MTNRVDELVAIMRGGETYADQRAEQRKALATVRSELERLREERDAARVGHRVLLDAQNELIERAESAEAELERLRRHPDAWSQRAFDQQKQRAEAAEAEAQRLTEGLRESEGVVNGLIWLDNNIHNYGTDAWRGYFKAVLRDARRARALLSANPPQGDAAAGSNPSDGEPVYCVCGNILGSENCCPEPDGGGAK